jgi:hypothetical protein
MQMEEDAVRRKTFTIKISVEHRLTDAPGHKESEESGSGRSLSELGRWGDNYRTKKLFASFLYIP